MMILLVDDHFLYRKGLRAGIEESFPLAQFLEAGDGVEALRLFEANPGVDLCVADIALPGIDGIALTAKLNALAPSLPIIIHSGSEDIEEIDRAIHAGATGYVSKAQNLGTVIASIRAALNGNMMLPNDIVAGLRKLRMQRKATKESISQRQLDVLRLCAEGLSNREIAARMLVSEATAKAHLAAAMRITGTRDRTSSVMEAIKRGWIKPVTKSS